MPFSLRCVQCMVTSILRKHQYVFCEKFARGRELVVDEEEPGRSVVLTTDAMNAEVHSLTQS